MENGPFDFSAMSEMLADPSIKEMAEKIAQDPAFAQMTEALQATLMSGGAGDGSSASIPPLDPAQYQQAMSSILENSDFMKMAEGLGRKIMEQDPSLASMMTAFNDPSSRVNMEQRLKELKSDPELAPIMKEIEETGPAALMKYWEDPSVIEKFGKAMDGAFAAQGEDDATQEDDDEEEPEDNLHTAAIRGDTERLKQLLDGGAPPDDTDEEGRTPLHFASGYGELECMTILLEANADINATDDNANTALHYAAGYGQPKCVELLLKRDAKRDAKNADGKTAAEVAEVNNQDDIVKLLNGDKSE